MALVGGAALTAATWILGLQLAPVGCTPCLGPGPCLTVCKVDFSGHVAVAGLVGLVAAVLVLLVMQRLTRPSSGLARALPLTDSSNEPPQV